MPSWWRALSCPAMRRNVLTRGVGAALSAFGVVGALANPKLRVFRGSAVVAETMTGRPHKPLLAAKLRPPRVRCSYVSCPGACALQFDSKDAALVVVLVPRACGAVGERQERLFRCRIR